MNLPFAEEVDVKAYAKINWFLRILSRRSDGYHELDMLMQTISLHDDLKVRKSHCNRLFLNGILAPDSENNLIIKAANALASYTGQRVCADFYVNKRIPSMAGLGGGSSDCAAALKAIKCLYGLEIDEKTLSQIAMTLGADVPFFLTQGLCRVGGIGEKVLRLAKAPLANLVICHVPEGLSTPAVYRRFDEIGIPNDCFDADTFVEDLLKGDYNRLKAVNDLERPANTLLPQIDKVKQTLLRQGAFYALMSGSGSAVYGVFEDAFTAQKAAALIPGAFTAHTLQTSVL